MQQQLRQKRKEKQLKDDLLNKISDREAILYLSS